MILKESVKLYIDWQKVTTHYDLQDNKVENEKIKEDTLSKVMRRNYLRPGA